jgi:hypothetical protein
MPSVRNRYQEGSLEKVSRAKGPSVWVYRWRELRPDGARVQRKKVIGNTKRIKTLADAKKAVEHLRLAANAQAPVIVEMTVAEIDGGVGEFVHLKVPPAVPRPSKRSAQGHVSGLFAVKKAG